MAWASPGEEPGAQGPQVDHAGGNWAEPVYRLSTGYRPLTDWFILRMDADPSRGLCIWGLLQGRDNTGDRSIG